MVSVPSKGSKVSFISTLSPTNAEEAEAPLLEAVKGRGEPSQLPAPQQSRNQYVTFSQEEDLTSARQRYAGNKPRRSPRVYDAEYAQKQVDEARELLGIGKRTMGHLDIVAEKQEQDISPVSPANRRSHQV